MIHDYAIRLLLRGIGAGNVVKRLPSGFSPPRVPRCHCEERSDVAIPPAKQARCAEICSPPMQTPSVIASEARQSRHRSQAGAPTHIHPSNEPPLSLRAKRGNPATEAKPVRPRISTPQTNPLCHCEQSAAINRSQAGVPTHVHPSNEPTMSLRAKRGNPVTEAKPVRRQMFNLIEIATSLSPSQ